MMAEAVAGGDEDSDSDTDIEMEATETAAQSMSFNTSDIYIAPLFMAQGINMIHPIFTLSPYFWHHSKARHYLGLSLSIAHSSVCLFDTICFCRGFWGKQVMLMIENWRDVICKVNYSFSSTL